MNSINIENIENKLYTPTTVRKLFNDGINSFITVMDEEVDLLRKEDPSLSKEQALYNVYELMKEVQIERNKIKSL